LQIFKVKQDEIPICYAASLAPSAGHQHQRCRPALLPPPGRLGTLARASQGLTEQSWMPSRQYPKVAVILNFKKVAFIFKSLNTTDTAHATEKWPKLEKCLDCTLEAH
jgi:hypothetical protein